MRPLIFCKEAPFVAADLVLTLLCCVSVDALFAVGSDLALIGTSLGCSNCCLFGVGSTSFYVDASNSIDALLHACEPIAQCNHNIRTLQFALETTSLLQLALLGRWMLKQLLLDHRVTTLLASLPRNCNRLQRCWSDP